MTANQIQIGKYYAMKVSGKLTVVRVDRIMESWTLRPTRYVVRKYYRCTNMFTMRDCIAHSAAKFRYEVYQKPDGTFTRNL